MSLMNFGFTKNKSGQGLNGNNRSEGKMLPSPNMKPESISPEKTPVKPFHKHEKARKSMSKPASYWKGATVVKTPTKTQYPDQSSPQNTSALESPNSSPEKGAELNLPLQKVKLIMKSCPDVDIVPQEPLHLITKAAELFIVHLVNKSIDNSSSSKLDYDCLSEYVNSNDYLDFLKETIPKKITWAECQKRIAAKNTESRSDLI